MTNIKLKNRAESKNRRPVQFLDRSAEKRRKGVFFEPEAKTYRWIAARDR